MVEYSAAFRARMVQRMTGPRAVSANALSKEVGVHQPTLSRWLREAATVAPVAKKKSRPTKSGSGTGIRPEAWSAEEKVRVVMESAGLSDAELGTFLRREGLHEDDLARFRDDVRAAAVAGLTAAKKARSGTSEDQKRIKTLERELKRKEAALAETAALLVLRKKLNALWGDEGDDT
jgi:transposase-like protein